jgi:hypothetical protein
VAKCEGLRRLLYGLGFSLQDQIMFCRFAVAPFYRWRRIRLMRS